MHIPRPHADSQFEKEGKEDSERKGLVLVFKKYEILGKRPAPPYIINV